jgi:4-amino-4-deoxy-L-arabinose transferase-like glycosyltransferase
LDNARGGAESSASAKIVGAIFAFALAVRVAAFIFLGPANWEFGDAEAYRDLGQNLAAGRGFRISILVENVGLDFWQEPAQSWYIVGRTDEPTAFYEPVFPLLLAACYKLFGNIGDSVYLAMQLILGSWWCVLIYYLARRIARPEGALIAGLFAGLYPSFVFYSIVLMTDMLFFFLLLLTILQGFRYLERRTVWNLAWLAMLLAITTLTRSVAIVAAPLVFVALLLSRTSWRVRLGNIFVLAAVLALFFGAWMWRNYRVFHQPLLLPTKGSYNFWDSMACLPRLIGEKEKWVRAREHLTTRWDLKKVDETFPELKRRDLLFLPKEWAAKEPQRAQQLTQHTMNFLAANPVYAIKRYLKVAAKMYLPFTIETNSRALQWGQGLAYLAILWAGLWGWWRCRTEYPILSVVALSLVIYGFIVPIYSIQNSQRSRMAFDAMLLWLAAYTFQAIYNRLWAKNRA